MKEELTIRKKVNKSIDKDINIATDPVYNNKKIEELLMKLKINNNPEVSLKLMKNFLKEDFAK